MDSKKPVLQEFIYFVRGMHCPSCEILIERKLLGEHGIEAVEASNQTGRVRIEYKGEKPSIEKLNKLFKKDHYVFSEKIQIDSKSPSVQNKRTIPIILISFAVILLFITINGSGLPALAGVNPQSALFAFFVFGLLAGISNCAALVGGIILSMSKQWSDLYSGNGSFYERFKPHLLFNSGRIISYTLLGGLLGALGGLFQFSIIFSSVLVFVVSLIMIILALQMLGVQQFRRFQFTVPKFVTRYVADESNFKVRYMPFLMGAATFLLPCGFTLSVQALAITSGSFVNGALLMLSFVLGTFPGLALIGISSTEFLKKPHLVDTFLKVSGILVLFFALYNMNSQLNVLGFASLSDINLTNKEKVVSDFVPVVRGKQLIKMDALSYTYKPNYFKIKAGQPVRWEITDQGTSGCTNAIISRGLFEGEISLVRGETTIKEFTVETPGKYKFTCWMGMVSGIVEVVDADGIVENSSRVIPSGASGSCESSCTGSCGGGCGNQGCSYK